MYRKFVHASMVLVSIIVIFTACGVSTGDAAEKKNIVPQGQSTERPFDKMQDHGNFIGDISPDKVIKDNVYLEGFNMGGKTQSEAIEKISSIASKKYISPKNASLNSYTWKVKNKGRNGKKANIERTLSELMYAEEGQRKELVIEEIEPDITCNELENNIIKLGSYTTPLLDRSTSRVGNIKIAARKIEYEKIAPGKEFSYNKTLGKRTRKKGYRKAPIFLKTKQGPKKVYDYGGGICQLSSTLYNAVLESSLEVTERHTHSKRVYYVPKGMDATVSYGASDFKFVNNRPFPVMITVNLTDTDLTVNIYENRN